VRLVADLVEDLNTAVENGTRLSAYIAMRKGGVAADRAAYVARELTVNFNRKGEMGPAINAAYIFFNASVQGSVRMVSAVMRSKPLAYAVAGIAMAGFWLDIINSLMAGEDDDGRNAYDKIPAWLKERNIIVMIPGTRDYIMLPMAYGYNVPFVAGHEAAAVLRGKRKPLDAAIAVTGSIIDMFNPLGTVGSIYQMAAPTILDPGIQILENATWNGQRIFPPKYDDRQPDSELYNANTPKRYLVIAQWLNDVTGGSMGRPGYIDVSPETLEHYAEFMTGGVGKFLMNAWDTGSTVLSGEEWRAEETPFVRRLFGKIGTSSRRHEFYEAWDKVDQTHYEVEKLQKNKDRAGAQAVRAERAAELKAYPILKGTYDTLKTMRKQRDKIRLNEAMPEAEKKARIEALMERENALVVKALQRYGEIVEGDTP
jgi:hypothetical protein